MLLSERAQRYLATLERRPATTERHQLEDAFAAAGVPVLEPIIDFQVTFGGYVEKYGRSEFVWGILHQRPDRDSFFSPNELHVIADGGEVFVTCANCHASDHWFLDASGALYWCFSPPLATSFMKKIERDAIARVLDPAAMQRVVPSVPEPEFIEMLLPRIREGLVPEASDAYESIYLHDGVYAAVTDREALVYLYEDRGKSLLAGMSATLQR